MTDFDKEWAKMLNGDVYEAQHPRFHELLMRTREALYDFNNLRPSELPEMKEILRGIMGSIGEKFHINQPFRCDYGCNIHIGENFFANFNLTILDEAEVRIGDNVFVGPNVSIYTACHPIDADERRDGREWAEPVTIGDDVWIGGGVTICPGVEIGSRCVVGAGSVVTRDLPPGTLCVGNPARPIREI